MFFRSGAKVGECRRIIEQTVRQKIFVQFYVHNSHIPDMKHLCFLLYLSGLATGLSAQPASEFVVRCPYPFEKDFDSTVVVIARSGLKLRDQPSFKGKTLALMPFAKKVKLLTLPRFDENGDHIGEYSPDSIFGSWLKVRYGKQVGYAFSAYLGSTIKKMTEDYYLLSANGSWCSDDSYISMSYHYYGIFQEKDSSWVRRSVEPVFLVYWTAMFGVGAYAKIKVNGEQPLFLLATRAPMPEGKIATTNRRGYFPGSHAGQQPLVQKTTPASPWIFEMKSFRDEHGYMVPHTVLKNRHTGKTQWLEDEYHQINKLVWEGDLDGDGVMDFILSDFQDIITTVHLFLSKDAPPGKLMRKVSEYHFSGCC